MRIRRLYLRIYLHVVAIVVVVAAVCLVVPGIRWRHQVHRRAQMIARDFGGFVGSLCSEKWNDPAALDGRIRMLSRDLTSDVAVRRMDGSLVTASRGGRALVMAGTDREALAHGQPVIELHESPARVAAPIWADGTVAGYVVIAPHGPNASPFVVRPPWKLFVALLVLVVAVIPLTRSVTRPLERLTAVARAYGAGELTARAETDRADEIGVLGRALAEMAERIRKLLDREKELLANVSHELRTPLTRIRVALELADGASSAEDRATTLRGVGEDLAELERLIDDVLTMSRLDLASFPLRPEALSIGDFCDRVAERAAAREATKGRELRVEVICDRSAVFMADPALLRRALDNLVDNAARYSPSGKPIELFADADGERAVFRVRDGGIGIHPEDQRRLFEPFFRADRSRTRATGGLGLGLALTRRIVEAHGGRIAVDSAPDRGTTVTLSIPSGAASLPPPPVRKA